MVSSNVFQKNQRIENQLTMKGWKKKRSGVGLLIVLHESHWACILQAVSPWY